MYLSRAILLALTVTCVLGARVDDTAELAKAKVLYQEVEALFLKDREGEPATGAKAKEALAIREALLGPDAEEVAWSLLQVYHSQPDQEVGARPLLARADAIFKAKGNLKGQGKTAIYFCDSYSEQDLAIAITWADKSLELRRASGDRVGESESLIYQACNFRWQTRFLEARATFLKALAIQEALGLQDDRAFTLAALGVLAQRLGDRAEAMDYTNQALLLSQQTGNARHEAETLNHLAELQQSGGAVLASMATLEKALTLNRRNAYRNGEAATENLLGLGYELLGEPAKALAVYELSRDNFLAAGTVLDGATASVNLSMAYRSLGALAQGIAAAEQGLALLKKANNPRMEGHARRNLGVLYLEDGRLNQARACVDQALALDRANQDREEEARALFLLSRVLARQGRAAEAIPPGEQSLAFDQAAGNLNDQAKTLAALARLLHETGRLRESSARYADTVAVQEGLRESSFPALTEARQMALSATFEATRFEFIAHAFSQGLEDSGTTQACFDAWLAHKGAVLDAQERTQAAILQSPDPQVRDLAQTLTRTRLDLAVFAQRKPSDLSMADYRARLEALQAQRTAQEDQLASLSPRYATGAAARRLDATALARLLPPGSAYLDFARIQAPLFNPENTTTARYAVFLLRPGQPVVLADLGPAELVDARVQALRQAMAAGRPVAEDLAVLHRLVLQPLEAQLAGASSFIISPSGALNTVPFELLRPKDGQPLMDRGPVSYVTSGKDLARFTTLRQPKGALAILANPDFDFGLAKAARVDPAPRAFPSLPGTHQEGLAIARAFPQRHAQRLEGAAATEAALLAIKAPWVLHLATHGYTLAGTEPTWSRNLLDSGAVLPGLQNPMTRTGLALAGANRAMAGQGGPGLFSADKVLGLDLSGTSLVVLSACGTGLGSIQDAEGVFGLRRAFILAGAQTLVVSLWPVPDADTRQLMAFFYRGLARGLGKADALLQAKQAMRVRRPHPRDWAGFVLVGNPI